MGVILFAFVGCVSIWEDYDTKVLENKEYEQQVQVKEIETPAAAPDKTTPEATAPAAAPEKTKSTKKEPAKAPKKTAKEAKATAPAKPDAPAEPQKHLPAIEDGEGFYGRRPIVDPFVPGETLEFSVRYFALEAGRFTMTTKPMVEVNGRKSYHFSYHARSSSIFSAFYAVDDTAEAYLDYELLVPHNYSISAKESKQIRDVKNVMSHQTRKAKTWDKKIKKNKDPEIKEYEWTIEPYAQNVLTVSYYLRCFKLVVGKKLAVHVAHEGKNIIMRAEVVRAEKLSTPMGKLDTLVVKPSFEIDGVFKPVGDVFMWVTNDKHKRLVRIESKIKIGTIVAAIEKISP